MHRNVGVGTGGDGGDVSTGDGFKYVPPLPMSPTPLMEGGVIYCAVFLRSFVQELPTTHRLFSAV